MMSSNALAASGQLAEPVNRFCDHASGTGRGQNVWKRHCGRWTKQWNGMNEGVERNSATVHTN
jgi:hypothetical protein